MKFEPDCVLQSADGASSVSVAEHPWRSSLPVLGAAVLTLPAIYWDTAKSMLAIWKSSDTFAHGYLIVPITLSLVWLKRRQVAALTPRPDVLGFLLLAGAGFTWLAAEAAQVQVLMQYALVAMVPAAVLALAGRRVAWTLAFPL
ncbi:MAG: archaeosortase/exosortase family protein, partial [Burkholderiales bacterium]